MDTISPLITQGGLGVVAAVFLVLYVQERKEHRDDTKAYQVALSDLQEKRLEDKSEMKDVLHATAHSMELMSQKIEVAQRGVKD